LIAVAGDTSLLNSDLIRALGEDRVVAVRGSYEGPSRIEPHWMLATSYTVDSAGTVNRIVANDPWTGKQVQIDPNTRSVVAPTPFPLRNWQINGYQIVSFRTPPEDP
jgi:hypothetical protein